MIAVVGEKRKDGKNSFSDLVKYIEAPGVEEKTLFTDSRGFDVANQDSTELIREMESTAGMNKRTGNPVFHGILSWRELETPSKEQIDEAVDIYLREMGFENCQCYYGAHKNTDNIHVHVCVNRIDPVTHHAVDPGFWKKADERAARKIELAQGWEVERSGVHYEVIDGEIYERESKKRVPSLSSKAKDFENMTSAKSAERIAQEKCSVILFQAKTWNELHKSLAEAGCSLERKGSGGVLLVGSVPVKLSKVNQQLSMKKMEVRLGAFEARSSEVIIKEAVSESVRPTLNSRTYLEERKVYYREKSEARKELSELFKSEQMSIRDRHRDERKKLYESRKTWKGHGAELNALKSALAWQQLYEWKAWKENRAVRRKELSKEFKQGFPSYEQWLIEHEKDNAANLWRYRESVDGVIHGDGDGGIFHSPEQDKYRKDMCKKWKNRLSALLYVERDGEGSKVIFADAGKRIDVVEWRSKEAVVDALKLASQKWAKGVMVNGSEAYKRICVKAAVENGINIVNPELQEMIRLEKAASEKMANNKYAWGKRVRDLSSNFSAYDEAVGADRYRVTAMYINKDGERRAFVLDKDPGMESVGYSREEVESKLTEIDRHDMSGKNMYLTPMSDDMHHILVDDLSEKTLAQMQEDGYEPAVILESSPGNFQAILNVPKLQTDFDVETANKLMRTLNSEYGDPKISGAVHPHRIPGTHNNKSKHKREDGTFPDVKLIYAERCVCQKAYAESKGIMREFNEAAEKAREKAMRKPVAAYDEKQTLSPYDAYMVHAKDMIAHFGSISDWSKLDAMVSVRMYVTGYSESERAEGIAAGSKDLRPDDMRDKHHWSSYGAKTAKFPETPAGQSEVRRVESKRNSWLRIEGRLERADQQRRER